MSLLDVVFTELISVCWRFILSISTTDVVFTGNVDNKSRRRQNLDPIGPDHGSDHGSDHGPDHGSVHGSDQGKKFKIQDSRFKIKILLSKLHYSDYCEQNVLFNSGVIFLYFFIISSQLGAGHR